MKPQVKRIIDALNAIIDETEDFNCCLDKIEFLGDENRLLISTQTVNGNTRASRNNKYTLRDNFFKGYLGVSVENLEGEYAFLISLDELSKLKIITDKMDTLQNPSVQQPMPSRVELRRTPQQNLQSLLETVKPSQHVLSKLGNEIHFICLNRSSELIPKGRNFITKGVDQNIKDNTHAVLVQLNTQHQLDNTLFINFTGHEAPVASALYMNGIDCIWQLSVMHDETSQTRIMDQLQDELPRDELLLQSPTSNDCSLGLILEPNHGFTEIDVEKLPSFEQLKAWGIKRMVLLTENNYNQGKCIHPLDENYFKSEAKFYHWLQLLSQDLSLLIIGVGNFEQTPDENCQSIETFYKKKDTMPSSTYKLPNFYTLFKGIRQDTPHSSSLGLNRIKQMDKKDDDTAQSALNEYSSLN